MIQRKEPRVPVSLRVTYSELSSGLREAYTTALGGGGCFLMSSTPPSEGTPLHLEFTLPTLQKPIRVMGRVAWRRTEYEGSRPTGIGIAFQNLAPNDKEAIHQYIDAVLSRKI